MITVQETMDLGLVHDIFTHPSVWPFIHDDGAPAMEDWQPIEHPAVHYLAIRQDAKVCGCLMLYPINHVLWELHSTMLPEGRGAGSVEAARLMMEWLWTETPATYLMTWVPAYNRAADVAARRVGFTEQTRLPKAYLKDGVYHDLILYGVEKCLPSFQ
jgi:RimJ/RimL family protein N-acetyltransferase